LTLCYSKIVRPNTCFGRVTRGYGPILPGPTHPQQQAQTRRAIFRHRYRALYVAIETYYTVKEVADILKIRSTEIVQKLFENEPSVVDLGYKARRERVFDKETGKMVTRTSRSYRIYRIPESTLMKVLNNRRVA
jgi:hypothetical protein